MVASGKPFISMLDYDGFDRCVHYSLLGGFNSRAAAYFYFYFFYELVKLDCYEKNKMFTKRPLWLKKIVLRLKKIALRRILNRRRVKGRIRKR